MQNFQRKGSILIEIALNCPLSMLCIISQISFSLKNQFLKDFNKTN